jgi:hypothetical protein
MNISIVAYLLNARIVTPQKPRKSHNNRVLRKFSASSQQVLSKFEVVLVEFQMKPVSSQPVLS